MSAEAEARAAEWRRQQKSRTRYKRARERALRGDPAAAQAVTDAWAPLLPLNDDGVPRIGFEDRA